MLLNDIYTILHDRDECNYESEANCLYYIVTYNNNQVELYEIEEYNFNGDNWGEIEVKANKYLIGTIKTSITEYLDAVITYANTMSHPNAKQIIEFEYPYVGHSIEFKQGEL